MACRRPCRECPWRKDTPPGQFPAERYAALRSTTGVSGDEAPIGSPLFACHMAPEGGEFECAGWLAAVGFFSLAVRILAARGKISGEALRPGPDWPELHESYESMERAMTA